MNKLFAAGLVGAALAVAAPAHAAEVTFDFTVTDFLDLNDDPIDGMVSGFFSVNDMIGATVGLIEDGEVTAFEATVSGFPNPYDVFNGLLSDLTEVVVESGVGSVEIAGSGLSVQSIVYGDGFAGTGLIVDAGFGEGVLENYVGNNDLFSFGVLNITLRDDPNGGGGPNGVIPLPAGLPLLLAGLGALGLVHRRRLK